VLADLEVESVALPALGAGLGGLRWDDVQPRIEAALGDLSIRVVVYPPQSAPTPEEMRDARPRPALTAARAALLGLLARFTTAEEGATPLTVQKLLYFLQAAGEPLRLEYTRGNYGPYADATRHLVQALEGHYLVGYGDGTGDRTIRLLPHAAEEAANQLREHPETLERLDRVAELIDGFESPYGLELLATTHWAAVEGGADDLQDAVAAVRSWSARKERLFTPEHITTAWERLAETGWLEATRVPTPA
jgi:O-acetyl-ADP-ribose deacetylase (regulator of RNase III)